jgi:hypothetical protein
MQESFSQELNTLDSNIAKAVVSAGYCIRGFIGGGDRVEPMNKGFAVLFCLCSPNATE